MTTTHPLTPRTHPPQQVDSPNTATRKKLFKNRLALFQNMENGHLEKPKKKAIQAKPSQRSSLKQDEGKLNNISLTRFSSHENSRMQKEEEPSSPPQLVRSKRVVESSSSHTSINAQNSKNRSASKPVRRSSIKSRQAMLERVLGGGSNTNESFIPKKQSSQTTKTNSMPITTEKGKQLSPPPQKVRRKLVFETSSPQGNKQALYGKNINKQTQDLSLSSKSRGNTTSKMKSLQAFLEGQLGGAKPKDEDTFQKEKSTEEKQLSQPKAPDPTHCDPAKTRQANLETASSSGTNDTNSSRSTSTTSSTRPSQDELVAMAKKLDQVEKDINRLRDSKQKKSNRSRNLKQKPSRTKLMTTIGVGILMAVAGGAFFYHRRTQSQDRKES